MAIDEKIINKMAKIVAEVNAPLALLLKIYDTKSFLATGSYLKDSSVTYIKIKKETTGVRGDSDE